jgi:hypothetical protein
MVLGWRYAVGAGWKRPASTTVDTLFAQRRPLTDRLGMDVRRAGRGHDRPRGRAVVIFCACTGPGTWGMTAHPTRRTPPGPDHKIDLRVVESAVVPRYDCRCQDQSAVPRLSTLRLLAWWVRQSGKPGARNRGTTR